MAVRHDFLSRAFVFDVAENSVHFSLSPSLCDDDIKKIWAFTVINSNAEMRELERVAGAAGGTRLTSWGGGTYKFLCLAATAALTHRTPLVCVKT